MPAPFRRCPKAAVATLAVLALVAPACTKKSNTSSDTGSGGTTTTVDAAKALGTPKKATGTPLTFGFVLDGKTPSIDNSSYEPAAKATAEYANNYLGGINGHPVSLKICQTGGTPSGATTCAVQMIKAKVDGVIVATTSQDSILFNTLQGSGIPYVTSGTAAQDILLKPHGYVLGNALGTIGAPAVIAKQNGIKKAAYVVIDVPAATGPISTIAKPVFKNAGVSLQVVPISPTVADQTPQIQQAISNGAGLFSIAGDEAFVTKSVKALRQLNFKGKIVTIVRNLTPASVASVPDDGFNGVMYVGAHTDEASDPDVQLMQAVMNKYANGLNDYFVPDAFAAVLGTVRALEGRTNAVNAKTIDAALSSMPTAVKLPLGAGITEQCGAKLVPLTPNACTAGVLVATLDKDSHGHDYKQVDTTAVTNVN